jgi:hypothetical protein
VGDLWLTPAQVVVEHDDRPLVGRKTPEAAIEAIPIGDRGHRVRWSGDLDREHPDLGGPAPASIGLDVARPHEDAGQPRLEPIGVTQGWEVAPSVDESHLHGVLGVVEIAKDPVRNREKAITRARLVGSRLPAPFERDPMTPVDPRSLDGARDDDYGEDRPTIEDVVLDEIEPIE